MADDLKQRLRVFAGDPILGGVIDEAADRIEQLEAEREKLIAELRWLLGESPDNNGNWFEPSNDEPKRPNGSPVARYWWRRHIRDNVAKLKGQDNDNNE